MTHSTTQTYVLKRDILTFANKISRGLKRPGQKFTADMVYGILASGSCLLTDIADTLHEKAKKKNTVERLALNLARGTPKKALGPYLAAVRKWTPENPVILVDDTDIAKESGRKFEAIGRIRDGSASSKNKNVYKDGYHVTEAVVLTGSRHPASIFSKVHSSREKDYTSINDITFAAIERGVKLFGRATFVMDRGYDSNRMFLKLDGLGQDYVIRLTAKRVLWFNNRWISAGEMCNRRKGKIKMGLHYRGKDHVAYISHVKTRITASRKDVNLVLVYGITEHPMMLATNKEIRTKDDVISVARLYFSRWKIEEYFRAKKQMFGFEGFRVRSLRAINCLNFYVTVAMAYLNHVSLKPETDPMKGRITNKASPLKEKVAFKFYRLLKGIRAILAYAMTGISGWFRTGRPAYRQMCLRLIM